MLMIKVMNAIGMHTIQDAGRKRYQSYGIPVGGVMDDFSFDIANLLLGNEKNTPVVEISTGKIVLKFESEKLIAITGFAVAKLNGNKIPAWRTVLVAEDDILEIQTHPLGNFAYLSIQGTWQCDSWLESSATYLPVKKGGLNGQPLQSGDTWNVRTEEYFLTKGFISFLKTENLRYDRWGIARDVFPEYFSTTVRIIAGTEKDWFSPESVENFMQKDHNVSTGMNRMALLIHDIPLEREKTQEMLSVAVNKGAMQVTPDGTLYLLMSDAQTTGGYPRIGQVAAVDLAICSQLRSSRTFRFEWITVEEARNLLLKRYRQLQSLQEAIHRKYLSYLREA